MVNVNLVQIKGNFVSKYLKDDPDKLAGTMPQCTVVGTAGGTFGIIVVPESVVALNYVVSGIDECISQGSGSTFGHPGLLRLEVAGLINSGIEACICKQLIRSGETVNITDLAKDHTAIDIADAGYGHDRRIEGSDDISHLILDIH